jgi:hypothetical protein
VNDHAVHSLNAYFSQATQIEQSQGNNSNLTANESVATRILIMNDMIPSCHWWMRLPQSIPWCIHPMEF